MAFIILCIVLIICVITVALGFMKKLSKNDIMLEVTATCEGEK